MFLPLSARNAHKYCGQSIFMPHYFDVKLFILHYLCYKFITQYMIIMKRVLCFPLLLLSLLLCNVSVCHATGCIDTNLACQQSGENFDEFLSKFTNSAKFQYSRVKFPLKNPIVLLADDGETEKRFPLTKDRWALLGSDMFVVECIDQGHGTVYVF